MQGRCQIMIAARCSEIKVSHILRLILWQGWGREGEGGGPGTSIAVVGFEGHAEGMYLGRSRCSRDRGSSRRNSSSGSSIATLPA